MDSESGSGAGSDPTGCLAGLLGGTTAQEWGAVLLRRGPPLRFESSSAGVRGSWGWGLPAVCFRPLAEPVRFCVMCRCPCYRRVHPGTAWLWWSASLCAACLTVWTRWRQQERSDFAVCVGCVVTVQSPGSGQDTERLGDTVRYNQGCGRHPAVLGPHLEDWPDNTQTCPWGALGRRDAHGTSSHCRLLHPGLRRPGRGLPASAIGLPASGVLTTRWTFLSLSSASEGDSFLL